MKKTNTLITSLAIACFVFMTSCKKDPLKNPADADAPSISLNNGSTIFVDLHGAYTDPGATASDGKDGDLSSSISSSGTVDVNNAGMYIITYSVFDAAGNGGYATRTVYVRHTAATLAGTYNVSDPSTSPYTDDFIVVTATKLSTVKFANYLNANVKFDISGNTGSSITVPSQTITSGTTPIPRIFTGSGTVASDGKSSTITYTVVNPANSTSITGTSSYVKP